MLPPPSEPATSTRLSGGWYADIEYGPAAGETSATQVGQPSPFAATPSQRIEQKPPDPIRERFYRMRSLASGDPFQRNNAGLFYKQAKFMADFADDYPGYAPLSLYYPCYQFMGYEQLRSYFTWRGKARRGDIQPTDLSYIFLYVYELLACIGADSPSEGPDQLLTLWHACRQREPALDRYLPLWIKDYHVYYPLPWGFTDFINRHDLHRYYPDLFLFDANVKDKLAVWNGLSTYDITKSKFYAAGNEALMRNCFEAVWAGLQGLCAELRVPVENLFRLHLSARFRWYPFQRALFHGWYRQPDRVVEMPGGERFFCSQNAWTAHVLLRDAGRMELAGYLLKKTEACLRETIQHKHRIHAVPTALAYSLTKAGIPLPLLDRAIEAAVAGFHRDRNRTVVTVDGKNLERIRKEALGTRDRLFVPEDTSPPVPGGDMGETFPVPVSRQNPEPPSRDSDGWAGFKEALEPAQRKVLAIVLRGGAGLRAFADECGIMIEILADGINESAMDHIGDRILETNGGLTIYDEYRVKVEEMVGS